MPDSAASVTYCEKCGCNVALPCACAKDCPLHPKRKPDPERYAREVLRREPPRVQS